MASTFMGSSVAASSQKEKAALPSYQVRTAYMALILATGFVWKLIAGGHYSSMLTIAGMLQCFAVLLLVLQVIATSNTEGISVRALGLETASLLCRLSSTTWLNGYLPVDASGDWVYQAVDITSVVGLVWLICQVRAHRRGNEQDHPDTCPVWPAITIAFVCGALFHANMNRRPLFDSLWMTGLNLGVLAVIPQMWFLTQERRRVKALTSHYIAAMAFGRILSGLFMWHARGDISCNPWMNDINHAVYAILAAHALHLLFLGDFVFFYVRALCTQGFNCQVDLDFVVDTV